MVVKFEGCESDVWHDVTVNSKLRIKQLNHNKV